MTNIVDIHDREKITSLLTKNFLVEAGAGSGKTTSLVERMVHLIRTGTSNIESIVAITFTRKAADELKLRFQAKLEESWQKEGDLDVKQRLNHALQHIDRCFIGTVHSFCAKLLRERPIEAHLDLDFQELEENDDFEVLEESWQRYLQVLQEENNPILHEMDQLGIDVDRLFPVLRELKAYPDVKWVASEVEKPNLKDPYDSFMNLVKEGNRSIPEKKPEKGYDPLQKAIKDAIQTERFIDKSKDKDLLTIFELFNKKLTVVQNRWNSKEDAKFYRDKINDRFQMEIKPLIEQWKEYCHPKIVQFLKGAMSYYTELKRERSLLNFQDLLMKTSTLLKNNSEVRTYFQQKYRYLLVDEFQDTDPIQAEIMFFLTGENVHETDWTKCKPKQGSLFVVGDPKQAIYRFRRADIDTYNRVKELIRIHGGEVLQLTMNFRTVDSITTKLNTLFEQLLPEKETKYQAAYKPLIAYKKCEGNHLSGINQFYIPAEFSKKDDLIQKDGEMIAQFIHSYMNEGYEPKDFMVLTRYNEGLSVYANEIEKMGIPVSISGEVTIGETKEFEELVLLLEAFVDRTDEVRFVAALRGVFFGINDDDLFKWKEAGGQFTIYSQVPTNLNDAVKEKFTLALGKMQTYDTFIRQYSPVAAIEKIIEDIGFHPVLLKLGGNKRTLKSILQVIEHLKKHERSGEGTYQQIVARLKEIVFEKTAVLNIEEEENAVRVMNVHKAKGLEAPIVFLANPAKFVSPDAFTTYHIKRRDETSSGYFSFSLTKGFQRKEIAKPPQWDKYKEEEIRYLTEEERRILYVAATRAEKALIISRSEKNDKKNPWQLLFEIEGIHTLDPKEGETPTIEKKLVTISTYENKTKSGENWIENNRKTTFEYWSPTKERDVLAISEIERMEGGGMKWGSAVHEVLENVIQGIDGSAMKRNILKKHELPLEREHEINSIVNTFQQSKIWEEICLASEVLTEVPFTLKVDQGDPLFPLIDKSENEGNKQYYVTGVIDLIYKTEEGWVLIDFKTDRPEDVHDFERLKQLYDRQLQFYRKVWEHLTEEKVVRNELYFVYEH